MIVDVCSSCGHDMPGMTDAEALEHARRPARTSVLWTCSRCRRIELAKINRRSFYLDGPAWDRLVGGSHRE